MKFQVNIEVDEKKAGLSKMEVVELVLENLSSFFQTHTDAYYDIGVNVEHIVSGLTS